MLKHGPACMPPAFHENFRVQQGRAFGNAHMDTARFDHAASSFGLPGRKLRQHFKPARCLSANRPNSSGNIHARGACTGHTNAHAVFQQITANEHLYVLGLATQGLNGMGSSQRHSYWLSAA